MFPQNRVGREIKFTFLSGATTSESVDLQQGCFGTLIVPSGSALIGKTLQFVAVPGVVGKFAETDMLSTPITLAAGANALTADQIRECGAVSGCRLKINSSVGAESSLVLLWKS
jgi:hypothetical protein